MLSLCTSVGVPLEQTDTLDTPFRQIGMLSFCSGVTDRNIGSLAFSHRAGGKAQSWDRGETSNSAAHMLVGGVLMGTFLLRSRQAGKQERGRERAVAIVAQALTHGHRDTHRHTETQGQGRTDPQTHSTDAQTDTLTH